MSDRTSAGIFSDIFVKLAEDPSESNKEFAKWLWGKSKCYDFSPYQLDCNDELIKLGLAHIGSYDSQGVFGGEDQDDATIIFND